MLLEVARRARAPTRRSGRPAGRPSAGPPKRIFVGGLKKDEDVKTQEADLNDYFSKFGECRVDFVAAGRGYAFIDFPRGAPDGVPVAVDSTSREGGAARF